MELHLHTLGELFELFLSRQPEALDKREIFVLIPRLVQAAEHLVNLLGVVSVVERQLVENRGNLRLDLIFIFEVVFAENCDFAAVDFDYVEQRLDCRRFACAVLPDKTHNAARGNAKADVIQLKSVIVFGNAADFDSILNFAHFNLLRK